MRKRILWFMAGVAMACSGGEDDFVSSESGREMPLLKPEIEAMDGVLPASLTMPRWCTMKEACRGMKKSIFP